ncbi:MAG: glucoamylase family protein [Candidatus Eisenbacteria bacterium]
MSERSGLLVRFACVVLASLAGFLGAGCHRAPQPFAAPPAGLAPAQVAFLDTLEHDTFLWFWDKSDPRTGLTPDRAPSPSFASVGAMGFALTAYPIGAERRWVTRAQAAERVRNTLRFLWNAPQDTARVGATGYKGFYYHFLEPETGTRFRDVELSTVDTALLLGGALFCQSYFDHSEPLEVEVRALAESLYRRVDWGWAQVRPPSIALGWGPEHGHLPYDWRGYDEALILHILALGSPTHPAKGRVWSHWSSGYRWGTFQGEAHLGFAPLFGHQYSHLWIDFRGIQDSTMRAQGSDYFENSRRATRSQRQYAIHNPSGFRGYGPQLWGLTACDGPVDQSFTIEGRKREFRTYAARGASFTEVTDDGTLSPAAAGGSVAFEPGLAVPALMAMRARFGANIYNRYGFVDAFNPTLDLDVPVHHGRVVPGVGWFDTDQLGIDQGPIVGMVENLRSGLVWRTLRRNPHVVRGLRAAGFTGGWLDSAGKR